MASILKNRKGQQNVIGIDYVGNIYEYEGYTRDTFVFRIEKNYFYVLKVHVIIEKYDCNLIVYHLAKTRKNGDLQLVFIDDDDMLPAIIPIKAGITNIIYK